MLIRGARILLLLCWLIVLPAYAGEDVGEAEALRRIEAAFREGDDSLDLRDLGLGELPPEIGQLTALAWLDVANNPLPDRYPSDLDALLAYLREQGE